MGKKQKENLAKFGKYDNHKMGGIAGRMNALAAKNELSVTDKLRPGRHVCLCQARIHELVMNCLGCGRIVCAQEGSGPCFDCGTLVCTREEREIINRGSKKSKELLDRLSTGKSYKDATEFRNKLLEADADTERRTKVNDLQSDYSNIERSSFLNAEEREKLRKRYEELRAHREKARRQFVVTLDVKEGVVRQEQNKTYTENDVCNDPVINQILDMADDRRRAQEVAYNNSISAQWSPKGFVPRYLDECGQKVSKTECDDTAIDAESLMIVSDEIAAQMTEEKGITIAVPQPDAAFLVHGLIRYYRWPDDVMIKGPVFIAAKVEQTNESNIMKFAKNYTNESLKINDLDFSEAAVLGRAFLEDTMMLDDFYEKYGSKSKIAGDGEYVLCFNAFEPFVSSVPHVPEGDMYELDRQLKKSLTR